MSRGRDNYGYGWDRHWSPGGRVGRVEPTWRDERCSATRRGRESTFEMMSIHLDQEKEDMMMIKLCLLYK